MSGLQYWVFPGKSKPQYSVYGVIVNAQEDFSGLAERETAAVLSCCLLRISKPSTVKTAQKNKEQDYMYHSAKISGRRLVLLAVPETSMLIDR